MAGQRGFRPDEIAEHAAVTELAAAVAVYREAGEHLAECIRCWALDDRVRARVVAEVVGVSRETVYRIARGDKHLGRA